jgi:ketosteroid isomerase-like protein
MPTERDVAAVRRLYAAVAAGDLGAVAACFHEDAIWHLPGRGALAGTHRSWPAIRDGIFARQHALTGGTFRARLLDLAVGESYLVAVAHATAERDGRRLDQTVCQLVRVRDGQIAEVRGQDADEAALDTFWGAGPGHSAAVAVSASLPGATARRGGCGSIGTPHTPARLPASCVTVVSPPYTPPGAC